MKFDNYLFECDRVLKTIIQKKSKYKELLNDYTARVAYKKYSIGGIYAHRGYYCPSRIIDIITNISRGKLTSNRKYDYVYGFDKYGDLILAEHAKTKEFIKRNGNFETGVTFCGKEIESISECEYYDDGRLKEYSYYLLNTVDTDRVIEYDKEKYEYTNHSAVVYSSIFSPGIKRIPPSLTEEKYVFTIKNNGISHYSVIQTNNPLSKKRVFNFENRGVFRPSPFIRTISIDNDPLI